MKFVSNLSKDTLICSELQVKDYKELLKCTYGDDVNHLIFIETISEVFSKVANKPTDFFKKANVIDLFCLLLDVRINSLGDICKVVITKDEKKMNLELRLDFIRDDLKNLFNVLSTTIEQNNIKVVFECPSVERLLQNASEEYLYFIKGSYINKDNSTKFIEITTNDHAQMFFEKLSPKVSLQIIEQFESFVKSAAGINFLSRYGIEDQTLNFLPSLSSLIWFTKLIFNESLESFYDNLFYLSHHGHMNAEYIENSAVGEYNYFVTCLKNTLSPKEASQEQTEEDFLPDEEDPGLTEEPL
jgi:hypothetical protein